MIVLSGHDYPCSRDTQTTYILQKTVWIEVVRAPKNITLQIMSSTLKLTFLFPGQKQKVKLPVRGIYSKYIKNLKSDA